MKKRKIVGIPRSMLFYRYGVLWKHFFINLNCKIVLSKNDNIERFKEINICNLYNSYLNCLCELSEKCDYVIVSSVYNYGKRNKVCNLFNINSKKINSILTKKQILEFKIKYTNLNTEFISMLKIGLKLTKNIPKIIYSYILATKKQKNYNKNKENYQKHLIDKQNKKILIMSNFYVVESDIINKITNILKNNEIILILSSNLNKKIAYDYSKYYKEETGNRYIKEMIGAYFFYQHIVSGVIYISNKKCIIDSILKNTSLFNNNLPLLEIDLINQDENMIENFIKKIK